ncbi:MAG TPA: OmpA family protein [Acidobacteriaceae bacterium]|nr:OmpA family protein [Acidobacteriaceae bacterium]
MISRFTKSMVLAAAMGALVSTGAFAQDAPAAPAPAAKKQAPTDYASRWDIFLGYSYLAPKGTVQTPLSDGTVQPFTYSSVNEGAIGSGAYYFNKYVGAQIEVGVHPDGANDGFTTTSAGLIFRYPTSDITPFAHALAGAARIGGPHYQPYTWGPALTVGGGMDYETPLFNHHLAIRLFQADYEYMHADFGPSTQVFRGRANIDAARLSAGIVLHVGSIAPPPPVTLACSASPNAVYPGEPVTITGSADMLNPKKKATYTWTGSGVTGSDSTGKVDTASLAPGSYTIKGNVTQGPKAWESADCSATFTVKQFEPPTVSCSANPTTIKPGDTSTITATGVSPQNRPLTYSYSASAGTVSGSGNSATFSSAGAPAGSTTVTCTVTDDKGQTASATTPVTIEAPPAPPAPQVSSLCSITFEKDKKRPARVDNEAKACLDDIAVTLQSKSDASLAVVGNATSAEKATPKGKHHKKVEDFASQRAVNTKDYLVTEKGIDASRITVYTGSGDDKKVEDYLVPSGASFSVSGATQVSGDVKAQPRKALAAKHHHKKAAK